MEQLIWIALGAAVVAALFWGFVAGAVANLFGLDFWSVAPIVGLVLLAFFAGRLSA